MTPLSKITVSAGIDQTTNSMRPSKDSSEPRLARALDDLYHQANTNVAMITGTTTTSMIAVELIRRSRCADAIGPCGSRMPCEQAPSAVAPIRTSASTAHRMSDLVCPDTDRGAPGVDRARRSFGLKGSGAAAAARQKRG